MHQLADKPEQLDLVKAQSLLHEQGYSMACRFGHVHATREGEELHVCLLADLVAMSPTRFLERLNEASKQSLRHVLSLGYVR